MNENLGNGWKLTQSYTKLPSLFYTKLQPTAVAHPELVVFNKKLAKELGLDEAGLNGERGAEVFSGNTLPEHAVPLAQAYAGHQFGHFTRLGDGRAILLGEQETPSKNRVDLVWKGAGRTPYSRGGDGRAGLGPMLREYLISEAMHALRIPTTRGLAVTTTGETIIREKPLPGAILTRTAASHLRVGTFEYAAAWGTEEDLQLLADYTIERHSIVETSETKNKYLHLLELVIHRQAKLIAKWQLVGFVHGVMNTDNMTISGETIDYGPCAFMDTYDRKTVFSSIDHEGRYAYHQQPYIGGWNLTRFAEALLPLIHEEEAVAIELAQAALSTYKTYFQDYFEAGMRAKLGLFNEDPADETLIKQLLDLMEKYQVDYTNTFISLTFATTRDTVLSDKEDFNAWYTRWEKRRKQQKKSKEESSVLMRQNNPAVIPRNHLVEKALETAVNKEDYHLFNELLDVLSTPYAHTSKQAAYAYVPDITTPYQTFCGT